MIEALRRLLRRKPKPPPGCRIEPLPSKRGFRLSGELDLYTVQEVREKLEPALHGTLVLDLAGLEYIDDDGLGLLLGMFKRLRQEGGSLVLRHPRGQITRVFETTGIAEIPGLTIERAPGD